MFNPPGLGSREKGPTGFSGSSILLWPPVPWATAAGFWRVVGERSGTIVTRGLLGWALQTGLRSSLDFSLSTYSTEG